MIKYNQPDIDKSDLAAVSKVLKSNNITQGKEIVKFESALKFYCGAKFAKVMNSATSALHLACLALDLKRNDFVWMPGITFVSDANCVKFCGAKIRLIDINKQTFNICEVDLEKKLKLAKIKKQLPKIVIIVHLAGNPCNLSKVKKLSKKFNFKIIEDASHALGSRYKKTKIGSCKFSDITVFSFHAVKNITTGEGGAILTNNKYIDKKVQLLRSHGINRNSFKNKKSWYYEQVRLGYNYRLTDFQAALGSSQIKKLDKFLVKRNKIAERYLKYFKDICLFQKINKENFSAFHLFIIILPKQMRDRIYEALKKKNIETSLHYIPIYKHPYYLNKKNFYLKNCEFYYFRALSIPIHNKLTLKNQLKIINIILNSIRKSS